MQEKKFSISKRARSFKHAFDGMKTLIGKEHNAQVHCFALVCVLVAGILLRISRMEWVVIVIACGMVLMAEALHTALEKLCDHVCPQKHPSIKQTKEIAAAAVFLTAIVALIVGLILFIPKLLRLF